MNVNLSADYDKRVPGKVLKWIATVNAAAKAGATDREIESMDEYAAIWQWYGENADSPEYQRLWENTWRT